MKNYLLLLFSTVFYLFFSSFDLFAPSFPPSWVETRLAFKKTLTNNEKEDHFIIEHILKNGIKVYLKPSKKEPGKVDYQFFALGGFSNSSNEDRAAAWLSPYVVIESGLGSLNGDEFACFLDDKGIEMGIKVGQFDHYMEVSCPITEFEYSLHLVYSFFANPICTEMGFESVLKNAPYKLLKKQQKEKLQSNELFIKNNLKNPEIASPFSNMDLDNVYLEKILPIYKAYFSNPSEFAFALVGDIEPQKIIPLLESTLGTLSPKPLHEKEMLSPTSSTQFQEEKVKIDFYGNNRYKASLTRITLPIEDKTLKPLDLDLICSSLKNRLIKSFPYHDFFQQSVKVFYEFPLFPCLDVSWIVIQFSSSPSKADEYSRHVLTALEKVSKKPLMMNELKLAYEEALNRKPINMSDLDELSLITNYCKAGWPILDLYQPLSLETIEKEMMKNVVECYPNLQYYSIISLHP